MYSIDFSAFWRLIIIILIACFFFMCYSVYAFFFKRNEIKSDKIIIPEKHLVIKNNQVDTFYIYKK